MSDDFLHRTVPAFGKRVHRLGLAGNYGIDDKGLEAALDRGLNYLYWPRRTKPFGPVIKRAIARDRDRFVVACGPTLGYLGGSVRRAAERALRDLATDYLDVFQLGWLGVGAALSPSVLDELVKLRESGKVRAVGTSIHDRARAGRLAEESPLDLLMIRYNAAHPGAEKDIFPHLAKRRPAVVAYTATSWRKLLARPRGWDGKVMSAGDCYRFCLTSDAVDVTLCGPKSLAELDENLAALARGPLAAEEATWMRDFGRAVHG